MPAQARPESLRSRNEPAIRFPNHLACRTCVFPLLSSISAPSGYRAPSRPLAPRDRPATRSLRRSPPRNELALFPSSDFSIEACVQTCLILLSAPSRRSLFSPSPPSPVPVRSRPPKRTGRSFRNSRSANNLGIFTPRSDLRTGQRPLHPQLPGSPLPLRPNWMSLLSCCWSAVPRRSAQGAPAPFWPGRPE